MTGSYFDAVEPWKVLKYTSFTLALDGSLAQYEALFEHFYSTPSKVTFLTTTDPNPPGYSLIPTAFVEVVISALVT